MNPNLQTIGASRRALLALLVLAAILPGVAMAADDGRDAAAQIERDARRMQEEARRQMAESERTQREALRSQEQSIRRMEETQQRMEQSARERTAQAREEQGRSYTYIYPAPTSSPPVQAPQSGNPTPPLPEPIVPRVQPLEPLAPAAQTGSASFGGMELATVSDRLGDYFGVSSGVLVVRAGGASPSMLQDGDVILAIDGRVPTDAQHAARILRSYQAGERVRLRVQRDRRTVELDTTAPGGRGK